MEYRNVNEAMEYHKKLYEELAKLPNYDGYTGLPDLKKYVISHAIKIDSDVYANCFLCDYANKLFEKKWNPISETPYNDLCEYCPVYSHIRECCKDGRPYNDVMDIFLEAKDREKTQFTTKETKKIRELFKEISELEIRNDFYEKI